MAFRALFAVLLLMLVVAPGAGAQNEPGSATPASSPTATAEGTANAESPATPPSTPPGQRLYSRVAPIEIKIPKIGLDAEVVPVGEDADGAMSAPSDPDTVAWYSLGPGTGGPGNVVMAGHVDWGGSLRTFGLLKSVQPGDQIVIVDELAREFFYEVVWQRHVSADLAEIEQVFGSSDISELTLITCGGPFDHSIRQYLERIVVRAAKV
jgi:sortase (surface protein transpeptidase)